MKTIITSCVDTGKTTKDGKKIYTVGTGIDKTCTSFGVDFNEFIGNDTEVDIKDGKEFQGQMQYYIYLPKAAGSPASGGGKFAPKDWTFEKRKLALTLAVEVLKTKEGKSATDIKGLADSFLTWLKEN